MDLWSIENLEVLEKLYTETALYVYPKTISCEIISRGLELTVTVSLSEEEAASLEMLYDIPASRVEHNLAVIIKNQIVSQGLLTGVGYIELQVSKSTETGDVTFHNLLDPVESRFMYASWNALDNTYCKGSGQYHVSKSTPALMRNLAEKLNKEIIWEGGS